MRAQAAFPGTWHAPWLSACERLQEAGYRASVPQAYVMASIDCAAAVGPEAAIDLADAISVVTIKAGARSGEALALAARNAAMKLANARDFRQWFTIIRRLATTAPESIPELLARTDDLLARLSVAGFEAWVLAGTRQGARNPEKRRTFFALESPDALRLLELEAGEPNFFDRERRLRAFQRALFGLAPPVRAVTSGRHDGARRRASFGSGVIRMPANFAGFRGPQAEAMQRAAMAHIGAHLRFSGAPFPVGRLKPLQIALVSLVEDARVEALAMRQMPGLLRLWLPLHEAQPGGAMTATNLLAQLSRALIAPNTGDIDGWVRKGRDLFDAAADRLGDPAISREIGNVLGNDLGQMRVQFNAKDYAVEPVYRDDNQGLWEPDNSNPAEPDQDQTVVESIRLNQNQHNAADQQRMDDTATGDSATAAAVAMTSSDMMVPVARFSEWDYLARRERPEWTTVLDVPARSGAIGWLDECRERRADVARRIDALVAASRVGQPERLRRRAEGDLLDLDACIEAAVNLRARRIPDHRVFRATGLRQRSFAVSVLLDVSQSTADVLPSGQSVLAIERDSVALMAHALDGAQDPFEINAFQSNGREEVRVTSIKAWDEPFGRRQGARLAGLEAKYSTRLGAALRWVGRSLASRSAHRRLVLLVTDGEPSDIDCPGPDYLIEDARHAVHGLAGLGVDCFCVAVGRHKPAVLDRIFGARNHLGVMSIEALPEKLPLLYLRLTR